MSESRSRSGIAVEAPVATRLIFLTLVLLFKVLSPFLLSGSPRTELNVVLMIRRSVSRRFFLPSFRRRRFTAPCSARSSRSRPRDLQRKKNEQEEKRKEWKTRTKLVLLDETSKIELGALVSVDIKLGSADRLLVHEEDVAVTAGLGRRSGTCEWNREG
jgi:hypothetical protein